MNDEQIKQLIERARRDVFIHTFTTPGVGWGLAIMSTGALWGAGLEAMATFLGCLLLLPATQITRNALYEWREFKRAPAWRLWREITQNPHLLTASSAGGFDLSRSLQDVYRYDPRGEILPITQALRLLLIYDLQQRRLGVLLQRVTTLRSVRDQLLEKSARLRELGDTNPTVVVDGDEMNQEIAVLEQLNADIQASCYRLETIGLSAHRAIQVKQLHREIAELKSSVSPSKNGTAQLSPPEITDIERQIGREIETYLQLERETETHLRDL
ncbi:hypothetical protein IAD21_04635 [Abditibacteriota bacterium]|nr:hypothetical protein IAD21_04635 [Abditibacteriota bacterium]